jgi:hypothetical protein
MGLLTSYVTGCPVCSAEGAIYGICFQCAQPLSWWWSYDEAGWTFHRSIFFAALSQFTFSHFGKVPAIFPNFMFVFLVMHAEGICFFHVFFISAGRVFHFSTTLTDSVSDPHSFNPNTDPDPI